MTIIKVKVWEALIANGTYVVHILLIKYGKVIVPVLISRLLFDLFNLLSSVHIISTLQNQIENLLPLSTHHNRKRVTPTPVRSQTQNKAKTLPTTTNTKVKEKQKQSNRDSERERE